MTDRICSRDGHRSKTLTEHLIHITTEHDHTVRRLRTASCHRCAKDIDVNVTRTCECGFTLPDDWADPNRTRRIRRKS